MQLVAPTSTDERLQARRGHDGRLALSRHGRRDHRRARTSSPPRSRRSPSGRAPSRTRRCTRASGSRRRSTRAPPGELVDGIVVGSRAVEAAEGAPRSCRASSVRCARRWTRREQRDRRRRRCLRRLDRTRARAREVGTSTSWSSTRPAPCARHRAATRACSAQGTGRPTGTPTSRGAPARAWLELQEETGTHIWEPVGVAWFAQRADGFEAPSRESLRRLAIPYEWLSPDDARAPLPVARGRRSPRRPLRAGRRRAARAARHAAARRGRRAVGRSPARAAA